MTLWIAGSKGNGGKQDGGVILLLPILGCCCLLSLVVGFVFGSATRDVESVPAAT